MHPRYTDKEHFYHDLSRLLASGIPLQRAVGHLAAGRDRVGRLASAAANYLPEGVGRALDRAGFGPMDAEILEAGERSGRFQEACSLLAEYYARLAESRRRLLAACAYPVFLLHFGVVVLAVPVAILGGGFPAFVFHVVTTLGMFYAAALVAWGLAGVARRSARTSAGAERLLRWIPGISGLFSTGTLARYCMVLSMGIRSATGIAVSLERAGRACGSASMDAASKDAVELIRQGDTFAGSLRSTGAFPKDLERAFEVSEASGRLEEETTRWAEIYRERFNARLAATAEWLPRILYILIAAFIAQRIFSVVSNVYGAFSNVLGTE